MVLQAMGSSSDCLDYMLHGRRGEKQQLVVQQFAITESILTEGQGTIEDPSFSLHSPTSCGSFHTLRPSLRLRRHQPNQRPKHLTRHRTLKHGIPRASLDTGDLVQSRPRPSFSKQARPRQY